MNDKGRPIKGVVSASSEADLYNQLQAAGLELIDCKPLRTDRTLGISFSFDKITTRDLSQIFIHLEQMQDAGVPLLDALGDIRDSTDNSRLRDMMSEINRDVSEGSALSEAMARHPRIFTNIFISLVEAGERSGNLSESFRQLLKYLVWLDDMQSKVRKASRYPMVVMGVVVVTVVVMMGFVVPQIIGFIQNMDQELPFYTTALMATSSFFQNFWWLVISLPIIAFAFIKVMSTLSAGFAYQMDKLFLRSPIIGPLAHKISISRYAQTFGVLFASGIDVISGLEAARKTVSNRALVEAFEAVERYVQSGASLSEAMEASGEFSTMVIRMVKVGEESGKLSEVLEQVSEFLSKDVDEEVQGLIAMIEPALTGILGGLILWIAAAVFGPIYSSFENINI